MGLRFIFIILALAVVYFALRTLFRRGKQQGENRPPPQTVDMVKCGHCGTHVPKSEALAHQGRYFCSKAHLERAGGHGPDG